MTNEPSRLRKSVVASVMQLGPNDYYAIQSKVTGNFVWLVAGPAPVSQDRAIHGGKPVMNIASKQDLCCGTGVTD